MDQGLKEYLQTCEPATDVDEKFLIELRRAMENVVSEIERRIQERERLAAEMRYTFIKPSPSARSSKN